MEEQLQALTKQVQELTAKLDTALNKGNNSLLTKKEYLAARKISRTKLWREEKRGQVKPIFIGSSKYYKLS